MIQQMEVRHPYVNELPLELISGFEIGRIDPEWQWVLVCEGKVKAQLLTVNAHGILYLLRITALPDAPYGWALALLRQVLDDCRKLGLLGYMVFLGDDTRAQRRIMTMIQRAGGYLVPVSGVWAAGRLETGY